MTRERLPQRRYSESFDFWHDGTRYSVTLGCHPDGRIGEVFMGMHKAAGTKADVDARDVAVLISLGLQHGVPLAVMLDATTKTAAGRPDGVTGALLAYLMEWEAEHEVAA